MKTTTCRVLLAIAAAVMVYATPMQAQTDSVYNLPYSQGFESGLGDWTALDYNNDGHTWGNKTTTTGASGVPGHNGSGDFAGSSSYFGGGDGDIAPDDFLVSPRIVVSESAAVLSWWYRVVNSYYPADHYSVYISTSGNSAADFLATTPVASITPTANDYGQWVNAMVDLSGYAGDTIRLAFRHHDCYGQLSILIDDVTVEAYSSPWTVTDTVPWRTGFDTPDTGWTFIGRCNGWYVGAPGGLAGNGLYVSGDGGTTNGYNRHVWNSRFHYAVRPLHFSDSGDYRVDYDWKCNGYYLDYTDTYYDYIRVLLAPPTASLDTVEFLGYGITYFTNSVVPTGWISLSDRDGGHLLADASGWTHHAQGFHVPAAGDYLLLVLAANGNSSTMADVAPAIDNLGLSPLTCRNTIDTLRLTANGNQGITVGWDDTVASQWAVYVNDSLCGVTASHSYFLSGSVWNAASCNDTLLPTVGVSPVCSVGDTALPSMLQAVWKNKSVGNRTVDCLPFALPYSEDFDAYRDDDNSYFGWWNLGDFGQYIEDYDSHSGTLSLNMRSRSLPSGQWQMVATPRFDAQGNQLSVSFWAKLPTYAGAATDTLLQVGILFDHDTMDYAHVAEATIPMLTLLGGDATGNWVRYQFSTGALPDTTRASITFSMEPHGNSYYSCYIDDVEVSLLPSDTVPPAPDTIWHTVEVTANADGVCEPYGSGRYADSSEVEIGCAVLDTLSEGGHWQFLGWDDGGEGNPRTVLITSDTSIAVLFQWVADSVGIGGMEIGSLSVYPNPSASDVTVSVGQPSTITILDMAGRVVIPPVQTSSSHRLPRASLPAGIYFVRMSTNEGVATVKLVLH